MAYNVLFLCTGNSARSIIAETLLNHAGKGQFKGFSAGSHPGGSVNPLVMEFLEAQKMDVSSARSKPWDEFAAPESPKMDLVITVCDQAAAEACPIWPGHPICAHWGMPDPAAYMHDPEQARKVIKEVFHAMRDRIHQLIGLPVAKLDRASLQAQVRAIGRQQAQGSSSAGNLG